MVLRGIFNGPTEILRFFLKKTRVHAKERERRRKIRGFEHAGSGMTGLNMAE